MATYSGSDKRLQYLFQHGGGGSLEDLDDVEITSVEDGQGLVYDETSGKWVNGEGGGGNANEQVLTKAEYDALTEEQKMNNTTYYINDADTWTSKEVQPVIYSTDEREIGVWVDGKPLYQRTYVVDSISFNAWTNITPLPSDVDIFTEVKGYLVRSGGLTDAFNFYYSSSNLLVLSVRSGGVEYYVSNNFQSNFEKLIATIRYTKTTDQPGSGIYTSQGQLAVHYSTEEHVIGTWIDGKPLYEKTINFGALPLTTTKTVAHNIANVDKIWIYDGFVYSTGGAFYQLNRTTNSLTYQWETRVDSTNVIMQDFAAFGNDHSAIITIRYTKTTD